MTQPDRLFQDAAFVRFYDHDNPWSEDTTFCRTFARNAGSLLDLGCGTGRFAATLAAEDGIEATGVDPAEAMLAVARARPGGALVAWVHGDAREIRLGRRFDLITMTGHAFQTALTDTYRRAVLDTVAAHLAPGGRFIFDTRNPDARAWESWAPETSLRSFVHPVDGPVEAWNDATWDAMRKVVTYDTFYRTSGQQEPIIARSQIGFVSQPRLARLLAKSGLAVEQWLGDWSGAPFAEASAEIIPCGRLA